MNINKNDYINIYKAYFIMTGILADFDGVLSDEEDEQIINGQKRLIEILREENRREDSADNNKINELSGRIWEELAPWERCDTSIEEIAEDMREDPLNAIGFLLDRLEDNTTTTPDTSKHAELAKRIFDEVGDEWTEDRETETKKIQEDLFKNPIYIFEALATNCKMWRELNDEN